MSLTTALLAAAALNFWAPGHGAELCPHGVGVSVLPAFTAMDVTLDVASGQTLDNVAASAPRGVGRCAVKINASVWRRLGPQMRCTVAVHELGHSVLGLSHSPGGHGVMSAMLTEPIPWCVRLVRAEHRKARFARAWRRVAARYAWRRAFARAGG